MQAKDAIKQLIEFCHMVTRMYVEDLGDQDLLVRSVPGTNHIAWQLGHAVTGTAYMIGALGHQPPALPAGFAEKYTKETAASDDPAAFDTKAVYLSLADAAKAASLAAVDARPGVDARIRTDGSLDPDAAGEPLADARRPICPDPPQARQAAVVLGYSQTSIPL
jgi:hypothetical protein